MDSIASPIERLHSNPSSSQSCTVCRHGYVMTFSLDDGEIGLRAIVHFAIIVPFDDVVCTGTDWAALLRGCSPFLPSY
eukprot:scaffold193753_cov49-Attheya_sp.AAC.2